MKMKTKYSVLLFALACAALSIGGCADTYSGYPGYGPYYGPGYAGGYGPGYRAGYGPGYGPGYGQRPYYGGYPGSVTVEVGDRPYYVHGAGYYRGHTYYVWKRGHWATRNGQRVWIHGHYVVRGY
jgi:hypothetical protein